MALHPIHRFIYEPKLDLKQIESFISSDPSCVKAVNSQNGYTPLHAATQRGDPAVMKLLIDHGCSLDVRARSGETAFLLACRIGILYNVHILAECGADSRIVGVDGKCALHYASEVGNVPIMQYLVKVLNHDVKAIDKLGNTALHYAVEQRAIISINYLLRYNRCEIRTANHEGNTSLHVAAKNGSRKIIWKLLSASKRLDILSMRNSEGYTAEDLARQGVTKGHKVISKQLLRWYYVPNLMRRIPWLYWFAYTIMPSSIVIIAEIIYSHLHNLVLAIILGVMITAIGFYLPFSPHRIAHDSGWHNPAFMGAIFTEVGRTGICYLIKVFPLLWPGNLFMVCCLFINSVFGLYIFTKFKSTDPGFDKVGKIGTDGRPLTILDVANQKHNLSVFQLKEEEAKGSFSVLQFCDVCEIVIPDRTKHCKLCESCCSGFDHHCLWLTSCVGYNNHRLFVLFTLAITIEALLFIWEGCVGFSVSLGERFLWDLKEETLSSERWLQFRIVIAICMVIFTVKVLYEHFCNIANLETGYFRHSNKRKKFSWRTRLKLVYLFFTDYRKWYTKSCQTLSNSFSA